MRPPPAEPSDLGIVGRLGASGHDHGVGHHGQVAADPRPNPDASLAITDRATLRRKKERGTYDRAVVHAVLDEGLLCHVGFSVDGSPFVMPMAYARMGEALYLHGATGNRMLRQLADGAEVCITVTLLDALVLARSAFHHSMNFRSVVLFGTARPVSDDDEKNRAMVALVEHIAPGRSAHPPPDVGGAAGRAHGQGAHRGRFGQGAQRWSDRGAERHGVCGVWAGQVPMSTGGRHRHLRCRPAAGHRHSRLRRRLSRPQGVTGAPPGRRDRNRAAVVARW